MATPTPEELAKEFARRWFAHESCAIRDLGERELAKLIRKALEHPDQDNRAA